MAKKATSTKETEKAKAPPRPAPATSRSGTTSRSAAKTAAAAPAAKSSAKSAKPSGKGGTKAAEPVPAKAQTVTLKHLAANIAERHGMAKKQADTVVADVFGRLVDHLKAGERVRIGGLGIIEVKNRPARMGRNPATGEAIQVKASRKVAFRAAKELKEAI